MVVTDFSKKFDPAYLSNGLIGIRPGPNPLAMAATQVSGFVYSHIPYGMESLSPAPYPLETDIQAQGTGLLEYPDLIKIQRQTLDMATGELETEMTFATGHGVTLNMRVLQFASRPVPSLICQEIQIVPSSNTELQIVPCIDADGVPGRVFMDYPPEQTEIDLAYGLESHGNLSKLGVALKFLTPGAQVKKQEPTALNAGVARTYLASLKGGETFRFQTIAAMVSQLYHPEPHLEAIRLANWGTLIGFETLRADNRKAWNELWKSRVKVSGDTDIQQVLDAAFFYLHSSLHEATLTGMPPFGLSQSSHYYGHSFWDTESWSLLAVTLATPETARSLVNFRVRSLPYAKQLASLYGYRGAQFPWEAAPIGGFESTPTFAATGWEEQHSTPDVALGVWEYQLATNDQDFLKQGAWPVLSAVAEWIESRGMFTERGFEIHHVMGPDEGVPNVNNNSYMNLICKMVMAAAIRCAEMAGEKAPKSWIKIRDAFYLPIDHEKNIVLPYDNPPPPSSPNYSPSNLDYLTIHDSPLSVNLLRNTHDFEQNTQRARAAGALMASTTSPLGFPVAAMAATAAFLGEKDEVSKLLEESWRDVWLRPFGMIREAPSEDYGCFLTDFGSLLQTAMLGFTGLRIREGIWQKYPASLPAGWRKIEIDRIWMRGEPKHLIATDGAPAKLLDE